MKRTFICTFIVLIIFSCSSLTDIKATTDSIPDLGAIVASRHSLLNDANYKVGMPSFTQPIAISLNLEVLTKNTLKKLEKFNQDRGKPFPRLNQDSLESYTRYYTLRFTDLIGLTSALNDPINAAQKEYMATDSDLEIIYEIKAYPGPQTAELLEEATGCSLQHFNGELQLKALGPFGEVVVPLWDLGVFEAETAGICWIKDKRGKLQVAAINPKGGCPGDTEKDPTSLASEKSYLKF